MGGKGFKQKAHPPSKPKQKAKKVGGKLENYTLCHVGTDGVIRTLEVEAKSQKQAFKKFNIFLNILDLYSAGASDEQILDFIKQNPIDDGGEP